MPIHILPGEDDPSGVIMPQQAFPAAMFGPSSKLETFDCETNPTYLRLGHRPLREDRLLARTLLVNSGQPLNDMFKYIPSPPNTRLAILESTLRWRHLAPTAPDTLWCHPYFDGDPFIIPQTPDIYIVGGQKRFATQLLLHRPPEGAVNEEKRHCRIIMVPEFRSSGILVMVNFKTLEVRTVKFDTGDARPITRDIAQGLLQMLVVLLSH
jgi:DNA polymerase delta subunit 2